jgi:hypothetical protein
LAVAAAVAMLGTTTACGPSEPPRDTFVDKDYPVPALRFAGVDLKYALRRVAGAAGVIIVIDELRQPGTQTEDLAVERIDVDLPAGGIKEALETLHEAIPAFDYRVEDGLMLVRSRRVLAEVTALDLKDLPASKVTVDFRGMINHIMAERPRTYLRTGNIVGMPARKKIDLDIAQDSSVLDAFVQFARKVETGLLIRRAGYQVSEEVIAPGAAPEGAILITATTVEMIRRFDNPRPLTRWRNKKSLVVTMSSMQQRAGKPFVIRDRSLLQDNRGELNFKRGNDLPDKSIKWVLDTLATGRDGRRDRFTWTEEESFIRIDSTAFDDFPTGRVILQEELEAGSFEGTLAELTRYVNANRKNPSAKILMGGEILADAARAKIEVRDGMTVQEMLDEFASQSGEGWVYIVRDNRYPHQTVDPGTWSGGYMSRLQDWQAGSAS